jgi:hypothetical protein
MTETKNARTRLQIIEDELIEVQELITSIFIERDIAMELQDVAEAEKQYSYIKPLTTRRTVLKKMLDLAQMEHDKKAYFEIPATIFIRNFNHSESPQ